MGKHKMIAMAIITGGCDNKPLLEQPFAMNALGIVAQDVPFGDVINSSDRGSLSVTFSTKNGDVHLIGAGSYVLVSENIVISMTFVT